MEKYLLGIDLGTTGVKSIVFDLNGQALGVHYVEYDLIFTEEGVEQDANRWWACVAETTRVVMEKTGIAPQSIAGISVSTQGIAGVLTDENGKPLMNALSWLDVRASKQVEQILGVMDSDAVFAHTGKNINPCYSLPALMWLKQNRPEVFAKASNYLLPLDFLNRQMTGRALMDYSIACGTMAYDLKEKKFVPELLDNAGLTADIFAPVGCIGDLVGELTEEAAEVMGLCAGIPVALGAQDQRCASIGAGAKPGVITISLGTSAAMCMLTASGDTDPQRKITLVCVDDKQFTTESVVSTAGAALKWFKNTVCPDCSYDDITAMAATSPRGANGVMFFPELEAGPDKPAGCFIGLRLATTRADMARAVLEGVARSLQMALEDHERCAEPCHEIRVFGGGALSGVWRQIIADMTGKPVVLPATHETGCLGAAILAAKGAGLIDSVFNPGDLVQPPKAVNNPDPAAHSEYNALCLKYENMRRQLG